jgi:hypothetical protein
LQCSGRDSWGPYSYMYVGAVGCHVVRELALISKVNVFEKPMLLHNATAEICWRSGTTGLRACTRWMWCGYRVHDIEFTVRAFLVFTFGYISGDRWFSNCIEPFLVYFLSINL